MREVYQIFYKNNKFDDPNKIAQLEHLFYNIQKPLQYVDVEPIKKVVNEIAPVNETAPVNEIVPVNEIAPVNETAPVIEIKKMKNNNIFEPKQKDSIFWCIFMYIYGYNEYNIVGSKYGNRELEEKQKMIAFFKDNPKILKTTNHKITNGNIQEIYSEYLSVHNETTLLGVIGFVLYYNIRILLVDETKKVYVEYCTNSTTKTCVLLKNTGIRGQTKYKLNMSLTDEMIQTIENTMLCLEHYTKPLRSVSTYSLTELKEIRQRLGLCILNSKQKKQDLYNEIAEYCGTFL